MRDFCGQQFISEARQCCVTLLLTESGQVRLRGKREDVTFLIARFASKRLEVTEALQSYAISLATQNFLRRGEWPPIEPVCRFHIGNPNERCRRCGATWAEYLYAMQGSAPIATAIDSEIGGAHA